MVSLAAADCIDLDENPHVYRNMVRDALVYQDIKAVLTEPLRFQPSDPDSQTSDWTVRGKDLSDRWVTVAVYIADDVVVVTAFVER